MGKNLDISEAAARPARQTLVPAAAQPCCHSRNFFFTSQKNDSYDIINTTLKNKMKTTTGKEKKQTEIYIDANSHRDRYSYDRSRVKHAYDQDMPLKLCLSSTVNVSSSHEYRAVVRPFRKGKRCLTDRQHKSSSKFDRIVTINEPLATNTNAQTH